MKVSPPPPRSTPPHPFAAPARVSRLQIEITTGCNLSCAGCQRTIGIAQGRWVSRQMSRETFGALLANLPDARSLILQGIGEPTLHPQLPEFLADARAAGRFGTLSFNTNALLRDLDYYASLREQGLGHLSVSVDSFDPAIAQRLRAGTDVDRLRTNLRGLLGLFPRLTVSCVLSRGNLDGLPALVDELAAMGVVVIEIQPLIGYGSGADALCLDENDAQRARQTIATLRRRHPSLALMAAPALEPTGARCRRMFNAVYVTVDGMLTPCCTTNDVSQFGGVDLTRTSFAKAWQAPGVARWLNAYLDEEPQICKGCAFNPAGTPVSASRLQDTAARRTVANPATPVTPRAPASLPAASPRMEKGIALQWRGRHEEAEQVFRSVAGDAEQLEALHRLGLTRLAQGDAAGARPLLEAAQALSPDPRYAHNLAVAWQQLGRRAEAIELMRVTLAAHRHYLAGYPLLASLLAQAGQSQPCADTLGLWAEQSLAARQRSDLERALEALGGHDLDPRNLIVLANLLRVSGREPDAQALLERRLHRAPDDLSARLSLAMARLTIVHATEAEIAGRRRAYCTDLLAAARLADALPDAALAAAAAVIGRAKPFFLAYQGFDDAALQRIYGRILERAQRAADAQSPVAALSAVASTPAAVATAASATAVAATATPTAAAAGAVVASRVEWHDGAGRRIRVGFASRYFHLHSVSKLFRGWIEQLDRTRFEVIGYHLGVTRDEMCAQIERACDHFTSGQRPAARWREQMTADALDVLIYPELGMDDTAVQLACHRIAPLQCAAWGHPVTSGLPQIDVFLSSELMEPPDAQAHYGERLVKLPNLSICYQPLPEQPGSLTRARLGLRESATVYVCCQSLFKYLPQHDRVFTELARRVGDCQFLFIGEPDAPPTRVFRERLDAAFAQAGLDAGRHVVIVAPVPFAEFASFLRCGDVYLDSIGWSGGNTTLEALACGLPVVTLPTGLMRGRHSFAILRRLGVQAGIAKDLDAYIGIAQDWSRAERREPVRAQIRERLPRLYGDAEPVRALESFIAATLAARHAQGQDHDLVTA